MKKIDWENLDLKNKSALELAEMRRHNNARFTFARHDYILFFIMGACFFGLAYISSLVHTNLSFSHDVEIYVLAGGLTTIWATHMIRICKQNGLIIKITDMAIEEELKTR